VAVEPAEGGALAEAAARAGACTRCADLVASRTQVVWGGGGAHADVLVVADAPGAREDALAAPLAGPARRLLDEGLAAAGLTPDDVWVTGLLKCRPPGNREPLPAEVASCQDHLLAAVELVRPVVVVALGEAVTKALRGRSGSIRERRGREEPRRLGSLAVWLYPTFHPAAAAYAPALTEQLRADLARLPGLVAGGRPVLEPEPEPTGPAAEPEAVAGPGQLGLF
jgi:uracil-DNA glycosylase